MELSVVTTMYDSAPYLEEFYSRICTAADKLTRDYEIIFVNDGAPENSLDIVVSLLEKGSRVRVINLSLALETHKNRWSFLLPLGSFEQYGPISLSRQIPGQSRLAG